MFLHLFLGLTLRMKSYHPKVWYDKLNKGVSILLDQLPYTLQFVLSYPIASNSKAA